VNNRPAAVAHRVLVGLVYAFLWLPILVIVVVSFDTSTFLRFPPRSFSLNSYAVVFQTPEFTSGLASSLIIAVIATALTLLLATLAALAFVRFPFPGSGAIQGFFLSPLMVPHIILGLAMLLLFSPLGLTDSYLGLILAHVVIVLPYALRTIMVSLSTTDAACEDAARVLGASRTRTFLRVTLPLVRSGLVAGGILSFLVSFDEAVVSLFLTGFSVRTLPVALLNHMETQAGPEVAALSVLLVAFSVILVLIVERVSGLSRALRAA
jgi:putative spermidine/putrescine transport system permease protein